jgi:acetylornithine deacetylase
MSASATLDLLRRLVAFDTTSRESNLDLIFWIESYLIHHGIRPRRVPNPDGSKAGLIARIGPETPGGLLLCGHTDTVPVDGQAWRSDPFQLRLAGDRVIGRGVVDMKGFIASVLAMVPDMVEADLQSPVFIGLTYDEEVGCLGATPVVEALLDEAVRPAWGIVGEATGMAVVRTHKGVSVMRTVVQGKAAHSSDPDHGASAIVAAARIVCCIEDTAARLRAEGMRVDCFDPPYTTMNIGTIAGGTALNIIPDNCELIWEFRFVPGEEPRAVLIEVTDRIRQVILPRLQQQHPEANIITTVLASVPALDADLNADAADALAAATGAPQRGSVSYGTDGGVLQRAGIPSVVYGPGDTSEMHQANESVRIDDLVTCDDSLRRIIGQLLR